MLGKFVFHPGRLICCAVMVASLAVATAKAEVAARELGVREAVSRLPASMLSVKISFDIPVQPLSAALQRYGSVTQLSVLAPSDLLRGRTSSALQGEYSPQEAIVLLLQDTGLQARFPGGDAVTVFAPDRQEGSMQARPDAASMSIDAIDGVASRLHAGYVAQIQRRVIGGLCARPLMRPGSYRMVLRFQVSAVGKVEALRHAGGSGLARRDDAILETIEQMRFDPPPPDMPQPVTLLIRQDQPGVSNACASSGR